MIAVDQTFENLPIYLDGGTFKNCTFVGCTLIYSGFMPGYLNGNTFDGQCQWQFRGPAANTLDFMRAMYAGGANELVDRTFEAIRTGGRFPFTAGNA